MAFRVGDDVFIVLPPDTGEVVHVHNPNVHVDVERDAPPTPGPSVETHHEDNLRDLPCVYWEKRDYWSIKYEARGRKNIKITRYFGGLRQPRGGRIR